MTCRFNGTLAVKIESLLKLVNTSRRLEASLYFRELKVALVRITAQLNMRLRLEYVVQWTRAA